MKIKTAEATKLQLDWGVTEVLGYTQLTLQVAGKVYGTAPDGGREQIDHTDPAVCMGLVKEHRIQLYPFSFDQQQYWEATISGSSRETGNTVEQAVARCFISMKLGETFDVPDELGVQS